MPNPSLQDASLNSYDFTIAAGGTFRLDVIGSYFLVKTLAPTKTLNVTGDFGTMQALIQGQGLQNNDFRFLTLVNPNETPITGTILIGTGGYFDLNLILGQNTVIAVNPQGSVSDRNAAALNGISLRYSNLYNATAAGTQSVFFSNQGTKNIYINRMYGYTNATGITPVAFGQFTMADIISGITWVKQAQNKSIGATNLQTFNTTTGLNGCFMTGSATLSVDNGFILPCSLTQNVVNNDVGALSGRGMYIPPNGVLQIQYNVAGASANYFELDYDEY